MLIFAFVLGLFFLRQTIANDLPRMFLWQRVLFWLSDLFAVLLVLRWMFAKGRNVDAVNPNQRSMGTISGRAFVILMVASLLVDIMATSASHYSSYLGHQRAVPATATILAKKMTPFKHARHYGFDLSFKDAQDQPVETFLSVPSNRGIAPSDWQKVPILIGFGKKKSETLEILYDPELPKRTWLKDQPWSRTSGITVLFSVIHLFQIIVVFAVSSDALKQKKLDSTSGLFLAPLIVETIGLVFFGFASYQG